jgi:hypothetical protein
MHNRMLDYLQRNNASTQPFKLELGGIGFASTNIWFPSMVFPCTTRLG